MQGYEVDGEGLEGGRRGGSGVDGGAEEVEEWVDQQGPEVFDYEDGAPGDLEAWIDLCQ